MSTQAAHDVITGPEAARLAGITYRQLDHWARKGWVRPSLEEASGRSSRRRYSSDDVVRLIVLRHLAEAGWSVSEVGSAASTADLDGEYLVQRVRGGIARIDGLEQLVELITEPDQVTVVAIGEAKRRLQRETSVPRVAKRRTA